MSLDDAGDAYATAWKLLVAGMPTMAHALVCHLDRGRLARGELIEPATRGRVLAALGLSDDTPAAALNPAVLDDLINTSRRLLAEGRNNLAYVGFGEALAIAHRPDLERLSVIGMMTSLVAEGQAEHALRLGQQVLEVPTGDETATRTRQAAVQASQEGRHDDAVALWAQDQRHADAAWLLSPSNLAARDAAIAARVNRAIALKCLGRGEEAAGLYAQARGLATEARARQPDDTALGEMVVRTTINEAVNLKAMGRHTEAESLFAQAQQVADAGADAAPADVERLRDSAAVRLNRANNLCELGRDDAAARLYEQAAARLEALLQRTPDDTNARQALASALRGRAGAAARGGASADAPALLVSAVDHLEAARAGQPLTPSLAQSMAEALESLAMRLNASGRFEEAELRYREAEQALAGAGAGQPGRLGTARLRQLRALNLHHMGRHAEAAALEKAADEAWATLRDAIPGDEEALAAMAIGFAQKARALRLADRLAEADAMHGRASEVFDALSDGAWSRHGLPLARARNDLDHGATLGRLGRHREADTRLRRAQRTLRSLLRERPNDDDLAFDLASVCSDRGASLLLSGRTTSPDRYFAMAQRICERLALRFRGQETFHEFELQICVNRAQMARLRGRSDAMALHLQRGQTRLQHLRGATSARLPEMAVRLAHLWMQHAAGDGPVARSGPALVQLCRFLMDRLDIVHLLADRQVDALDRDAAFTYAVVHVVLGWCAAHADAGCADELPALLAEYHGRFADALRGHVHTDDDPTAALTRELRALASQVEDAEALGGNPAELGALRERLVQRRTALLSHLRAGAAEHAPLRLDARSLRQRAPAGRALVVLFHVPQASREASGYEAPERAVAMVFGSSGAPPEVLNLPTSVLRALSAEPEPFAGARRGGDDPAPDALQLRAAVADAWAALQPHLAGAREVFVALNGSLAELPWQAADGDFGSTLVVHAGVAAAVRAWCGGAVACIAPPGAGQSLGVLAHTPVDGDALEPIPGVWVDRGLTLALYPHSVPLRGRDELLAATPALVQLSCHGSADAAHTGPGDTVTTALELAAALRRDDRRARAVMLLACCSARARTSVWGESVGWAVALQDSADVVLGALHPIADLYGPLFVALLHREWVNCGDLRLALRAVRLRLRSGHWADDGPGLQALGAQWLDAIQRHWPDHTDALRRAREAALSDARAALQQLAGRAYDAPTPDAGDHRLRTLAECIVLYG
jgi:tetratricopeptide (TPR) repeat protein